MKIKSVCEKCETKLTPESIAYICSYECTFCESCAMEFKCVCPNCAGELVRRPGRKNSTSELK